MTVTLGTPYTNVDGVDDATTGSFWLTELPGVNDKAVVFYTVNDTTNYKLHARVVNTSGDSISSIGAEQTLVTSVDGNDIIDKVYAEAETDTRILVVWRQRPSSYEMNAAIATVSGDTVTIGTVRQIRNTVSANELVYGTWITTSSIICLYIDSGSSNMYVAACTVSGSTISAPGTEVAIDTTLGSAGQNTMAILGAGDGSRSLVLWDDASNLQTRIAKITTGTTVTVHTVNSFLASSSVQAERLRKIPDDTTTFIGQWQRGITPIPEAVHLTIVPGSDTITQGTVETWHAADAQNTSGGLAILSATLALTCWTDGIGTPLGMVSEMDISGTTLTVDEADDVALAKANGLQIVKVGNNKTLVFYNDVDAVIATTSLISALSKLWLRDATPTWNNLTDGAWPSAVEVVAYLPGTNYQTIYAAIGTDIYESTDGGASWASVATLTFTPASLFLVSSDILIAYNKASGGTNRVAEISGLLTTPAVSYLDTGHSTTGEGSTILAVA
jgi:hypothetical protein